jgi:effector-binding domain-containing protein
MKFLKGLLITVVVIFIIYCVAMFFLPARYVMDRQITIDAPSSEVYETVVEVESWTNWSYWDQIDSTNETSYFGPKGEVGYGYTWKGDPKLVGEGTYTISALEENQRVDYDLTFVGMGESKGYFEFEAVGENETQVTYAFIAEFGFFDRVGKFFIDAALGKAFEESLAKLKTYIETMPEEQTMEIPDYEVERMTVEAMPYYGIKKSIAISEMSSNFFGENYQALGVYLGADMANATMAPFAIYEKWDQENDQTTIIVAMAVTSEKPETDNIMKGNTYAGDVLKINYYGSYEGSEMAHMAMDKHMMENDIEMTGAPYEVYVTDPSTEPDTAKWLTEIYYPVAAVE